VLDLSPDKLAMLALVALVVLGPNRLPQAARSMGRLVANLRSMTSSFHEEVSGALDSTGVNLSDLAELHPAAIRRNVVGAVAGLLDSGGTQSAANPPSQGPGNSAEAPPGSLTHRGGSAEPVLWGSAPDDPSFN
jgi:sec-independent protein translocase protein TatB